MTKLLRILAPSAWSIGELANAIVLAKRLPEDWRAEVLVSAKHLDYAHAAGVAARVLPRGRAAAAAVREAVSDAEVSGILLADHHLLGLERVGFGYDDLASRTAPLVAFDSLAFGVGPTRLKLAVSRGSEDPMLRRWFPPEVDLDRVPDGVPLLRPVPVAAPISETLETSRTARIRSFDLYGASGPWGDAAATEPERIRSRLGIEPHRKLVVVAMSNWASMAMTKPGLGGPNRERDAYLQLRFAWLHELMRRLDEPIALVGVSAEGFEAEGADVQTIATGFLPLAEFTELLAAADLYLTDNLTSGAMARAVLLGTPAVTLTREVEWHTEDAFVAAWLAQMRAGFPASDFDYLVNPFGWIDELQPLLANNAYLAALPRIHAHDLDGQVRACRTALDSTARPAQDALNAARGALPSGSQALLAALDAAS